LRDTRGKITGKLLTLVFSVLLMQALFVPNIFAYDQFPGTNIDLTLDTLQTFNVQAGQSYPINAHFNWDSTTNQYVGGFLILEVELTVTSADEISIAVDRETFPMKLTTPYDPVTGKAIYSMWAFNPPRPPFTTEPAFIITVTGGLHDTSVTISQRALYYNGALTGNGGHGWGTIPVTFKYTEPQVTITDPAPGTTLKVLSEKHALHVTAIFPDEGLDENTFSFVVDGVTYTTDINTNPRVVLTRLTGGMWRADLIINNYGTIAAWATPVAGTNVAITASVRRTGTTTNATAQTEVTVKTDANKQPPAKGIITDGDPVFISTGEFYQQSTDLTIPGRGFPFSFVRTYRSQSDYNGPLGWKWDFNYNARLENYTEAATGLFGLMFHDGAGRRELFIWTGTRYEPPAGLYKELLPVAGATPQQFTLTDRSGEVMTFTWSETNQLYNLTSIEDRNNNQMTLNYGPNSNIQPIGTPSNVLLNIQDTLLRTIAFTWDANNRIDYFTDFYGGATPANNRKIDFTYNASGELTSVTSPVWTPPTDYGKTGYPSGKITTYEYSSDSKHYITGVIDPKRNLTTTKYITNVYTLGRVTSQQYGDSTQTFEFDYTTVAGQVTVTDRNGNKTVYVLRGDGTVNSEIKKNAAGATLSTTVYNHNQGTERTYTSLQEGNSVSYNIDDTAIDPRDRGNIFLTVQAPDTDRQTLYNLLSTPINTYFTYEPRYNQVKISTDARNPAWVTTYIYDYEEDAADLNGDGLYGESKQQNGNVIKIAYPNVTQPVLQTDIYQLFRYNANGQLTWAQDQAGIITAYDYYASNDSLHPECYGYLKTVTRDVGTGATYLNYTTTYVYDRVGNINGITDHRNQSTAYLVNPFNQVFQSTTPAPVSGGTGYVTKFFYDANDNLWEVWTKNKDEAGTDGAPAWIKTTYAYDILDNMEYKYEDMSVNTAGVVTRATTQYGRDDNDNVTDVTQPVGNKHHTEYDALNRVYSVTEGYLPQLPDVTIPLVTTNFYDGNNNLIKTKVGPASDITGAKGRTTYGYDGFDRRVKTTDGEDNYSITGHDANGNVTSVIHYNAITQKLSQVNYDFDELNRMWQMTVKKFDAIGGTETDVVTTYRYDKKGRRIRVTEPNLTYTATDYDGVGRVLSVTTKDSSNVTIGTVTEYVYTQNATTNTTQITEKDYIGALFTSYVTLNTCDNLGRLIQSEDPAHNFTGYAYDSRNNLKKVTDRENNITFKGYDLMNRLIQTRYQKTGGDAPVYVTVQYGYDGNGRMTNMTDDNSKVTDYVYDAVNRRKTETLPPAATNATRQVKTYVYNSYGVLDSITDFNSNTINMNLASPDSYDNNLRLKRKTITYVSGTMPDGATNEETYAYDDLGRMTSASNFTTVSSVSTLICEVGMAYDSMGNLLSQTQLFNGETTGKTVTSHYDDNGFKDSLTYPGPTVARQISFVPDALNRTDLIKEGSPDTGTTFVDYNYDGAYRVKERLYGISNNIKLTVGYDANGRVSGYSHGTNVTASVLKAGFAYAYDKEGNKKYEKRTHESTTGIGDAYKYDALYRLTGVKYGVTNLAPATNYTDYTGTLTETFALDGAGNRTSVTNGTTVSYAPNGLNQYDSINSVTHLYDANGNLTDDGVNTYAYDYANRLLKVTLKSTTTTLGEYKYDALGRRIEKRTYATGGQSNAAESIGTGTEAGQGEGTQTALDNVTPAATTAKGSGKQTGKQPSTQKQGIQRALTNQADGTGSGTAVDNIGTGSQDAGQGLTEGTGTEGAVVNVTVITKFYYDGARCIEERDGSDVLLRQYVFGNGIDEILQRKDYTDGAVSATYYFHENSLGSIYAVTDNTGIIVEKYSYTAYGKVTIKDALDVVHTTSPISNRFMYTGREWDAESGLYYYRARYYSPAMGRFLQRDSFKPDELLNLYTYVTNNPIRYTDSLGLIREEINEGPYTGYRDDEEGRLSITRQDEGGYLKSKFVTYPCWTAQLDIYVATTKPGSISYSCGVTCNPGCEVVQAQVTVEYKRLDPPLPEDSGKRTAIFVGPPIRPFIPGTVVGPAEKSSSLPKLLLSGGYENFITLSYGGRYLIKVILDYIVNCHRKGKPEDVKYPVYGSMSYNIQENFEGPQNSEGSK